MFSSLIASVGTALTAMPTSCRRCSRRWAVTITSFNDSSLEAGLAAGAVAPGSPAAPAGIGASVMAQTTEITAHVARSGRFGCCFIVRFPQRVVIIGLCDAHAVPVFALRAQCAMPITENRCAPTQCYDVSPD